MPTPLERALAELEDHVGAGGWDQQPVLFALVETHALLDREPQLRTSMPGLCEAPAGALTPIQQETLPDSDDLGKALATLSWPPDVLGCALVQEVVVLPPEVESRLPAELSTDDAAVWASAQPERREVRLGVAVLRDGSHASCLRLRPSADTDPDDVDLLTGPDLAPRLADALLATFADG